MEINVEIECITLYFYQYISALSGLYDVEIFKHHFKTSAPPSMLQEIALRTEIINLNFGCDLKNCKLSADSIRLIIRTIRVWTQHALQKAR